MLESAPLLAARSARGEHMLERAPLLAARGARGPREGLVGPGSCEAISTAHERGTRKGKTQHTGITIQTKLQVPEDLKNDLEIPKKVGQTNGGVFKARITVTRVDAHKVVKTIEVCRRIIPMSQRCRI